MAFQIKKTHLQLAALFLLALPVFVWIQWQPQTWLNGQLATQGMQGTLHYASVSKSFPGLQLEGVNISAPGMNPLALQSLLLRPAFSTLLSGSPGLFTKADSEGISAESVIAMRDKQLELGDVHLHADAASLSHFDSRLLLLDLSGSLDLQGRMLLQMETALPLDGNIDLNWDKPSSLLLPPGMEKMQLTVNAADAEGAKIWNWKIESTPDIVTGEGKIVAGGADIRQWLLRGKLRTMKGGAEMVLSGTLGAPHLQ